MPRARPTNAACAADADEEASERAARAAFVAARARGPLGAAAAAALWDRTRGGGARAARRVLPAPAAAAAAAAALSYEFLHTPREHRDHVLAAVAAGAPRRRASWVRGDGEAAPLSAAAVRTSGDVAVEGAMVLSVAGGGGVLARARCSAAATRAARGASARARARGG